MRRCSAIWDSSTWRRLAGVSSMSVNSWKERKKKAMLFSIMSSEKTRGNDCKPKYRGFRLNTSVHFCAAGVPWHNLCRGCEVSLEISRSHLNTVRAPYCGVPTGEGDGPGGPGGPCQHQPYWDSVVLWSWCKKMFQNRSVSVKFFFLTLREQYFGALLAILTPVVKCTQEN